MLKKITRRLIVCVGLFPLFLLSMDNGSQRFTAKNIWGSIDSCCEGQVVLTGRSQLAADIDAFRSSARTEFVIPHLPVIRSDGKLCIVNVSIVKKDVAVDALDAAITMMAISESQK